MPDIAVALGVAKSTAFGWVRHLPLGTDTERARAKRQQARQKTDAYRPARRAARAADRACVQTAMAAQVGQLTQRELLLAGAVAYWCERAKSDHATRRWAAQVGVAVDRFQRPTLKRQNPRTTRRNVVGGYRGCLVITVPRIRKLYWQVAGIMQGLVESPACDGLGKVGRSEGAGRISVST